MKRWNKTYNRINPGKFQYIFKKYVLVTFCSFFMRWLDQLPDCLLKKNFLELLVNFSSIGSSIFQSIFKQSFFVTFSPFFMRSLEQLTVNFSCIGSSPSVSCPVYMSWLRRINIYVYIGIQALSFSKHLQSK